MKQTIRILILSLIGLLYAVAGQLETPQHEAVQCGTEITWEIRKSVSVRAIEFEIVNTEYHD